MGGISAARQTDPVGLSYFAAMFGAPNNWRLESDGKLTKDLETPEYKEAVGYVRDLCVGRRLPSRTHHARSTVARARLPRPASSPSVVDTFNGWQDAWRAGAAARRRPLQALLPVPGSRRRQSQFTSSSAATCRRPRLQESQRRTASRSCCGSRTGWRRRSAAQEDLLLTFGVQGNDYTLDDSGSPTLTPSSNRTPTTCPGNTSPSTRSSSSPRTFRTTRGIATTPRHAVLPSAVSDPTFGAGVDDGHFAKGVQPDQTR